MLVENVYKRLGNTRIDLIYIQPQLIGRLSTLVLHRLNELGNRVWIIIDHHDIGVDHLQVLVNLIVSKPLLLGIFIRSRVIRNYTLRILSHGRTIRMTLESKVKRLDLGRQSRQLLYQIVAYLGVTRCLINVCTDENEPH